MALTITTLRAAIVSAHARMGTLEQKLNAADAKLGDGDTGAMLARLMTVLAAVDLDTAPDLGAAFMALAKAGAASTGSSLGTLIITAMMTAGKVSKAEPALDWVHFGPMLAAIRDAAMARGKAELGAKTIIDGLDYLVRAVDGLDDPRAIATAAVAAVDEALTVFRPRPCTMGRARMFAERSIGLDDPGMLALAELTRAVVQAPAHGAHHNG